MAICKAVGYNLSADMADAVRLARRPLLSVFMGMNAIVIELLYNANGAFLFLHYDTEMF
jgi:hypothetical protein